MDCIHTFHFVAAAKELYNWDGATQITSAQPDNKVLYNNQFIISHPRIEYLAPPNPCSQSVLPLCLNKAIGEISLMIDYVEVLLSLKIYEIETELSI